MTVKVQERAVPEAGGVLPWPMTLCGLVAMSAVYLNGGRFPGLVVLAAGLVLAGVVGGRVRLSFWSGLVVRGVMVLAVAVLMGVPAEPIAQWYVKPAYTSRLGVLLAAELVLRAWMKPRRASEQGPMLLVAAGMMMCAADTLDRAVMAVTVPLFVLATLLVAGRMNAMAVGSPPAGVRGTGWRGGWGGWRWAMAVVALGLGFGLVLLVRAADREITNWAMNFVQTPVTRRAQIGLGMSPRLQSIFNPAASPDRVLRLEGFRGERHVRVLSYTSYVDGIWLPRENDRDYRAVSSAVLRGEADASGAPAGGVWGRRVRITPLAPELTTFVAVPVDAVSVDLPVPADRDSTGTIRLIRGETLGAYEVLMGGEEMRVPLLPPPVSPMREVLLTVPSSIDRRVAELSRQVVGDAQDAEGKVRRIVTYLRSNHGYSLEFEPEGDPLSDFVLNQRAAHCQYFASAVVMMSRMVGVPARFVTGFLAHEAESEMSTVVRQRDAHAWAEVYIEGKGWMVAEATPAGGLPNGLFPEVGWVRRTWEAVVDFPGRVRAWLEGMALEAAAVWLLGLGLAAAGAYGGWRRWAAWRRGRIVWAGEVDPQLARAAARFDRLLARAKRPCPPGKTWREHVTFWPEAGAFLDAYDAARYGGRSAAEAVRLLEQLSPPR